MTMVGSAALHSDVNFSAVTFVVADNKPFFRDLVQTALKSGRAKESRQATTIDKAKEVLIRFGHRVGCIICDWDMVPVGGLSLLKEVRTGAIPGIARQTCFVILTTRADSAAVKSALALDVNGFAVAPLSLEKLIKTLSNAMHRSWQLQSVEHYAGVPVVDSPQMMPDPPPNKEKDEFIGVEEAKALAAAKAKATAAVKKEPELMNVRIRTLAQVKPGAVLARDVRDHDGHLLLKAGTQLSPALLGRLADVAKGDVESYHIWTGDRGAA